MIFNRELCNVRSRLAPLESNFLHSDEYKVSIRAVSFIHEMHSSLIRKFATNGLMNLATLFKFSMQSRFAGKS